MKTTVTFFPVGNGDMTLLKFESGRTLLIDVNIRDAADDPEDDTPDVGAELRERLNQDDAGRLYVDAFVLSHPDADHCNGLREHFYLGPPSEFPDDSDKIFIRELWSSPIVFRRASRNLTLCDDAQALQAEAKRRVKRFRDSRGPLVEGDRILVLGEDKGGKTDDLGDILIKVDDAIQRINGEYDRSANIQLLAPLTISEDDLVEESLSKNHSSVILRIGLTANGNENACIFLTAGDAEVGIWERLWKKHAAQPEVLQYDMLLSPHHCSWHALSYDSWSELRESAAVSSDARNALAQALEGAFIIAGSRPVKDDDCDPPCIRAKREYEEIAKSVRGSFVCVGERPSEDNPEPLEFEITTAGPRHLSRPMRVSVIRGAGAIGGQPLAHG